MEFDKPIYTLKELSKQTGMSYYILRKYRKKGWLNAIPDRKPVMFTRGSVISFIECLRKAS